LDVLRGDREDCLVGRRAGLGELGDGVGVACTVREGTGEDRRVRGHTRDAARLDDLSEVAARDAVAGQVVELDADASCGELCGVGGHAFSLMVSRAASTTASVVMPNFVKRVW